MPRMPRCHRRVPLFAIALLAGCAAAPVYGPDSPAMTIAVPVQPPVHAPLTPRLPLTLGLSFPAAIRTHVVISGGGNTPRVQYQTGAVLGESLTVLLRALFDRVVVVETKPAASGSPPVDLVASVNVGSSHAKAWVEVDFRSPQGDAIAVVERSSLELPQLADRSASIGYGAGDAASRSLVDWMNAQTTTVHSPDELAFGARVAMEDLAANVAVAVVMSDSLARWAAGRGAHWRWPSVSDEQARKLATARGTAVVACIDGEGSCASSPDTRALEAELRKLDANLQFVDADVAVVAGFPWIRGSEGDAWPPEAVLREESFAAALASVGVRRLVIWKGMTTTNAGTFPVLSTGVGALGAGYGAKRDRARAVVIDLAPSSTTTIRAIELDELRVTSAGAFIGLIPFIVPLPGLVSSPHGAFASQILPLLRD